MMQSIRFIAGRKIFPLIREEGLDPDRVRVMAGAAGGPKWLVLGGLDRIICSFLFRHREKPLFLIGSSIGAWRFAAISHINQIEALDTFQREYINQSYSSKPTVEEIDRQTVRIMNAFLVEDSVRQILSHPYMRLSLMTVRCRWPVASERRIPLSLGLLGAALSNFFKRGLLRFFFERTLFYDSRDSPPFYGMSEFPIRRYPLNADNLRSSLVASGSIPLVMSGVRDIPGATRGIYRDGGIVDYHLDIPFLPDGEGIVLYPHYRERITPGWFDKRLTWRKPDPAHMENVLLIYPSENFIEKLPYGKIPDRNDFYLFRGRDRERIEYWERVVRESERIGDEFGEAVQTGRIRELVEPISY
jgi:hypothetical protein